MINTFFQIKKYYLFTSSTCSVKINNPRTDFFSLNRIFQFDLCKRSNCNAHVRLFVALFGIRHLFYDMDFCTLR